MSPVVDSHFKRHLGAGESAPDRIRPVTGCAISRISVDRSAQGPKGGADLVGEDLRLFPGGEVAALGEIIVEVD
jgi:hypothetical protein